MVEEWAGFAGLATGSSLLDAAAVALAEGRFAGCEAALDQADSSRQSDQAGSDQAGSGGSPAVALLRARLRRDQGYPAEAEVLARRVAAEHPDPVGGALLAAILGDLGRDSEAGRRLRALAAADFAAVAGRDTWLVSAVALAELCWVTQAAAQAGVLARLLLPDAGRPAAAGAGAGWAGSVSRALGLLAAAVGDWDAAAAHLEAGLEDHIRAGAPVLVAHSRRELAAVLRSRGQRDDWERAFELLSGAESIYRRLGIESMAEAARLVLHRSPEDHPSTARPNVLSRSDGQWRFGPAGSTVAVEDGPGLVDLVTLLARPGQRIHIGDLEQGLLDPAADGRNGWRDLEPAAAAEERRHLVELEASRDQAERCEDRLGISLAVAERELLVTQLAARPSFDELDRARSVVGARVRIGIDRLERAHPGLGRHLRHSVAVGTFCSYEPVEPMSWRLG